MRKPDYRDYHIDCNYRILSGRGHGNEYSYAHDGYDGAEDSRDYRCGSTATLAEALDEIDELEGRRSTTDFLVRQALLLEDEAATLRARIKRHPARCVDDGWCESPTCPCCVPLRDAETRRLAQLDRLPDGPSGDPTAPMWPDAPVDVGHLLEPVEPGDALYLSREDVEGVAV